MKNRNFQDASRYEKRNIRCPLLCKVLATLLIMVLLLGFVPNLQIEAKAEYPIIMTANEFIGYLKYALGRDTSYNGNWPGNMGYYDGSTISWDCWDLGRSIIWTNGQIVYNDTKGTAAEEDLTNSGLSGGWDGWKIMECCSNLSTDFTNLIPGEWLYLDTHEGEHSKHIGYYIGDGQVIECTKITTECTKITTSSWRVDGVIQSQISKTGARIINGTTMNTPWQYHGMVPWIEYVSSEYQPKSQLYSEASIYKATKSTNVKLYPYAQDDEHPDSTTVASLVAGNEVTIDAAYLNKHDNTWFHVTAVKGDTSVTGYVYAGDFTYVRSTAAPYIDGNSMLNANIKAGNGYEITGTVQSQSPMTKIEAYVYLANASGSKQPVQTVTFDADTYSFALGNSIINTGIKMASYTTCGNYTFELKVYYKTNRQTEEASYSIKTPFVISQDGAVDLHDPVVYSEAYYLANNSDVAGMGWPSSTIQQHWTQNGLPEGRVASPVFDVNYYKSCNSDLSGMSNIDAATHFLAHGISEARRASEEFWVLFYKQNYKDLEDAYGDNYYQYFLHYINSGKSEGRIANSRLTVTFDANGGTTATTKQYVQCHATYGTLPVPTRSGYNFDGWYTSKEGGEKRTATDEYKSHTSETLYAHWTKKLVTGISLSISSTTLSVGGTYTLSATVSPSDALNKNVTWSTSNSSVATVSSGKITAVGAGTATITCTAADGSGKSATCAVTVKQPVTGITLSSSNMSMNVGDTCTLTATVAPSNASNKTVIWSTSNSSVATVSSGKITAVSVGTATITCAAQDGSGVSAACYVAVVKPSDTIVDSGTCGESGSNVQWKLTKNNVLTIYGTGNMAGYSSNTAVPWYGHSSEITDVVIESGVCNIGSYAFCGLGNMKSVSVSGTVTQICKGAFKECKSLTTVDIPKSVKTVSGYAFHNCTALKTVSMHAGLQKIEEYAFYGCESIQSIRLPDSLTSLGKAAFRDCSALWQANISNALTCVEDYTFYRCTNLCGIEIPESVKSINYMAFSYCGDSCNIKIPDSITSINDYAFVGIEDMCITLKPGSYAHQYAKKHGFSCYPYDVYPYDEIELILPESLTKIDKEAFAGNTAIEYVYVPSACTSIGAKAFKNCTNLKLIEISASCEKIADDAFVGCSENLVICTDGDETTITYDYAMEHGFLWMSTEG